MSRFPHAILCVCLLGLLAACPGPAEVTPLAGKAPRAEDISDEDLLAEMENFRGRPSAIANSAADLEALTGDVPVLALGPGITDKELPLAARQPALKMLAIHGAQVTDEGCRAFDAATGLRLFAAHACEKLTGVGLKGCPGLKCLLLSESAAVNDGTLDKLATVFPNLPMLFFQGGLLSDAGLAHLQRMSGLRCFGGQDNALITDKGLESLLACKSLRRVYFDRVKGVTGAGLARLAGLPALEGVYFTQCGANDAVLKALGDVSGLKELIIETPEDDGSAITDAGLAHVSGLSKLRRLCVRYAHVSDTGLAHIGKLAALDFLELRVATNFQAPHFTDEGMAALAGLKNLKTLVVSHNQLIGPGLAHLRGLDRLEKLSLKGCYNMWSRHLSHLKALPALAELDLSGCSFESGEGATDYGSLPDAAMEHVGACKALRRLDLSSGRFTDKGMAALSALYALEELNLSQCLRLTDASMESVAKMKSLRRLDLWGVKITAAGIEALKGSSLEELDLSECIYVTDDAVPALAAIKTLRRLKSKFGNRSSGISAEGLRRLRSSNANIIID